MGVQLLTAFLVSEIYRRASPAPYVALLLWVTLRARNVFVNGLFNDCFEMLFIYLAIVLLLKKWHTLSLLSFSAAVSVKMSALLFAPGAIFVFLSQLGPERTVLAAIPGVLLQVVLAFPFLLSHPQSYLTMSFEFSRNFHWFLSHTWKFLPERVFDSRAFHITLVLLHLVVLAIFAHRKGWFDGRNLSEPRDIVNCIFLCNFVGIVFARSLHYSFYVWYFHTLPLLLTCQDGRPRVWHPVLLLAIEICWNQWQSYKQRDPLNSCPEWRTTFILTSLHLLLLVYLLRRAASQTSLLPTMSKSK